MTLDIGSKVFCAVLLWVSAWLVGRFLNYTVAMRALTVEEGRNVTYVTKEI